MTAPHIIVVASDQALSCMLEDALHDLGYSTTILRRGPLSVIPVLRLCPQVVVVDILARWDGTPDATAPHWGFLNALYTHPATRTIPVIIMSANGRFFSTSRTLLEARNYTLLEKPFELDHLDACVRALIRAQ